ncbi:hypothetical protein [Thiorhodococcus minor]|uniref:Hpt domain-containing protein n=1 Tax=Thiorhodococcus minor TaxID=57489 RepID=A0A6M0JZW9_9GAMM|nr:hypothetical protein [Thiorhodococcus minor]NEV61625.1 hypothetical protein [Thiorhodococcus minor]
MPTTAANDVYDPDLALARAGGRAEVRDRMLIGLLDLLDDPACGGRLLAVQRYGSERAACREAAHRAAGVARQAATRQLETLLRALEQALEAGDLEEAGRLGADLPAIIAAVCNAVAHAGSSGSG